MIRPNPDFHSAGSISASEPATLHLDTTAPDAGEVQQELAEVVSRAQAGDLDAQSDLVRRYTRRIRGYIRNIINQPNAVDDVTQTVFIKMARRLGGVRMTVTFESWLFTLARNTAIDFVRRRAHRPVTVASEELDQMPASDCSETRTAEIMEALEIALAHLNQRDRALVEGVVEGTSYVELAARTGMTVTNVKVRLHRVRPFLRRCVGGLTATRAPEDKRTCNAALLRAAA